MEKDLEKIVLGRLKNERSIYNYELFKFHHSVMDEATYNAYVEEIKKEIKCLDVRIYNDKLCFIPSVFGGVALASLMLISYFRPDVPKAAVSVIGCLGLAYCAGLFFAKRKDIEMAKGERRFRHSQLIIRKAVYEGSPSIDDYVITTMKKRKEEMVLRDYTSEILSALDSGVYKTKQIDLNEKTAGHNGGKCITKKWSRSEIAYDMLMSMPEDIKKTVIERLREYSKYKNIRISKGSVSACWEWRD